MKPVDFLLAQLASWLKGALRPVFFAQKDWVSSCSECVLDALTYSFQRPLSVNDVLIKGNVQRVMAEVSVIEFPSVINEVQLRKHMPLEGCRGRFRWSEVEDEGGSAHIQMVVPF